MSDQSDWRAAVSADITVNSDGSFAYDPRNVRLSQDGELLTDVFTYTFADPSGLTATANVEVNLVSLTHQGDVAISPDGDDFLDTTDWVQTGRYLEGKDQIVGETELRRTDTAPRTINGTDVLGNGAISVADWVQTGDATPPDWIQSRRQVDPEDRAFRRPPWTWVLRR